MLTVCSGLNASDMINLSVKRKFCLLFLPMNIFSFPLFNGHLLSSLFAIMNQKPSLSLALSLSLSVYRSICKLTFSSLCLCVSVVLCLCVSVSLCLCVSVTLCLCVSVSMNGMLGAELGVGLEKVYSD